MTEKQPVKIPSFEVVQAERDRLIKRKENRANIIRMCGILIVIAAIAIITATRYVPVLQVEGLSMAPALEEGELIALIKTDTPQKGDVIGFYYENKILLKRVIGSPGDYVDIKEDGTVLVNGEILEETYITQKDMGECDIMLPCHVKDGEYFVMGDNRSISMDSRSEAIGCVPQEQIIGKIIFRIWPFERIGNIR